ncbi:hypothetical protein BHE74_00043560, partial [Ensete ventricosum]
VEAIINNSTKPLLFSRVLYTRNLFHANDELRNLRSHLRWMCVDQSNDRHTMISWPLFLQLGIFVLYLTSSYIALHSLRL